MRESHDIKVVLRDSEGRYVSGSAINWGFADDRSRAIVFDYVAERVEEQLEFLRKSHGIVLKVELLPANEIYETCDHCHRLIMPLKTFFDGERFLCPDCSAKAEMKQNPRRLAV